MKKIITFTLTIIALLFISVLSISGQGNTDNHVINQRNISDKIDSIVSELAVIYDVPGISVGVVQNGKSIYSKGYGFANIETKVPVTSNTLFKTGSVSKVITATAIMQLVEKGSINLDDKVIKHLKYFRTKDENYKLLTIRHLLTHTGGVPGGYLNNYGYQQPEYDDNAIRRFVESMQGKNFDFVPGDHYDYSNNGYVLLSAIVEEVSGMKFEDYISENILKPAGVTKSTSDFHNADISKFADGHVIGEGFKCAVNSFFPDTRWITGADGFYASSDDMNKISIALLSDYNNDSRIILKKETLKNMWTRNESGIGLCWNIHDVWGGKLIVHGGNAPGFSAMYAFFDDLAVSVLCNSDTRANRELIRAIVTLLKDIELKPLSFYEDEQILSTMRNDGIDAGIAELKRLKEEKGEDFRARAVMILALSIRQGTAEKRLEYAQQILETLIEYYPENEYMHLFLAEVYIRLALKHYETSNALIPGDWGIEKMYHQIKNIDLDFYK